MNEVPLVKFRSTLPAALVTVALLFGSACSSDDDDAEKTTTTQAEGGSTETTEPGADDDESTETETGDSASPASESDYVEALSGAMVATAPDGDPRFTQEQADCLSPRIVSILGVDQLVEQDVTPDDLSLEAATLGFEGFGLDDAGANEMYDSFAACDLDIVNFFVEGITAGAELDEATIACAQEAVTDEKLRAVMVGLMVMGEEAVESVPEFEELGTALDACAAPAG